MESANKKNSYELLSMSDSESDPHQQVQELHYKLPRRKRLRKKLPANRLRRFDGSQNQKCCLPYGKYLSLSFIIVILCCWLLVLSWLIVIFNDELRRYDSNLKELSADSQVIPQSLQRCQSQARELQRNQTNLFSRFLSLSAELSSLSAQISAISQDLSVMRKKLNSSSGSMNDSNNVTELSESVSSLKSWLSELNDTIASVKISGDRLVENVHVLESNLTGIKEELKEKVPIDSGPILTLQSLTKSITYLNNSLTSEIQLMKEKHSQDHALLENLKSLSNVTLRLDLLEQRYRQLPSMLHTTENSSRAISSSSTTPKLKIVSKSINETLSVPNFNEGIGSS